MRIEKEIVEEEINTTEDIVLTKEKTIFKKGLTCHNIVCEGTKKEILAKNISAWDISAGDISASFIVCEERKKKSKTAKTICKNIITNCSKYEKKQR